MVKRLKFLLSKEAFLKNILVLASGTALSNALTLLFSLVITRLYGPEQYGYLGVFTSSIYLFAPAIALTLPMSIVLAKSDAEAWKLAKLSLFIGLTLSTTLLIGLLIFEHEVLTLINAESLIGFGWLLPVAIFVAAVFQINEQWQIRTKAFSNLAKALNIRALFIGSTQSLMGLFKATGGWLVLLYTLGMIFQNIYLAKRSVRATELVSKDTYTGLLKRYSDFPIYRAPQVLLNSVSLAAPTLMFAWAFGSMAAGYYTIAFALLTVPATLLGKSVGDVFYKEVVDRVDQKQSIASLLNKTTRNLFLLGIFPFGLIALFGPTLFTLLYGDEWRTSGEYAQWIALWLLMMLVSRPAIAAIPVIGLQAHLLAHESLSLLVRVGAIYLGVVEQNPLQSIIYLSIANGLLYGVLILFVYLKSQSYKLK